MSTVPDLLKTRKKLWISLGAALLLIFILSNIPAVWGAWLLTRGTGLSMSGVTGSVWNGKASLASMQLNGQEHSLGQMSWKLGPLAIISRCAEVTTKLPMQEFDGEVCAGSNGNLEISDADISAPAAMLQSKVPVPIQGQISSHIEALQINGNVLQHLKGKLSWTNAAVNTGATWLDIGSYAAELSDNGKNGVLAKVVQLSGPLEVDLQLEFAAPAGGSVTGKLIAPQGLIESAKAADVLAMFSQFERTDEQNRNHYSVNLNF